MSRRFATGPPVGTAHSLGRRIARRVGGAVLAASVGALTASVAVSLLVGTPSQVQDPGAPDRTTHESRYPATVSSRAPWIACSCPFQYSFQSPPAVAVELRTERKLHR